MCATCEPSKSVIVLWLPVMHWLLLQQERERTCPNKVIDRIERAVDDQRRHISLSNCLQQLLVWQYGLGGCSPPYKRMSSLTHFRDGADAAAAAAALQWWSERGGPDVRTWRVFRSEKRSSVRVETSREYWSADKVRKTFPFFVSTVWPRLKLFEPA